MFKAAITSAAAAILLAGCASPEPRVAYQEPQGGPTAFVSFRNATPGRVGLAVYQDAATCTNRHFLPPLLVGETQTIAVPGGRPLAFSIRYSIPNRTPDRHCEVTASFETVADGRYEAVIRPSGENSCTVDLARLRDGQRGGVKAMLRESLDSSTERGPFCTGRL